jgi:hypothetical protein
MEEVAHLTCALEGGREGHECNHRRWKTKKGIKWIDEDEVAQTHDTYLD